MYLVARVHGIGQDIDWLQTVHASTKNFICCMDLVFRSLREGTPIESLCLVERRAK